MEQLESITTDRFATQTKFDLPLTHRWRETGFFTIMGNINSGCTIIIDYPKSGHGSALVPTMLFWGRETALPCPPVARIEKSGDGLALVPTMLFWGRETAVPCPPLNSIALLATRLRLLKALPLLSHSIHQVSAKHCASIHPIPLDSQRKSITQELH